MKRTFGSAALVVCASCADLSTSPRDVELQIAASASAAQPQTFTLVIPIQFNAWACIETVTLQGDLLGVFHSNSTDHALHGKVLFLQRLSGYGQSTGYKYEAIGNNNAVGMTSDQGAEPYNDVFTFRLVSRAAQLLVSIRVHTTVNANGDLTADVQESSVTCRVH